MYFPERKNTNLRGGLALVVLLRAIRPPFFFEKGTFLNYNRSTQFEMVSTSHCTCFQLLMQLPTGTSSFHLFYNCSYHLSSNRTWINFLRNKICCHQMINKFFINLNSKINCTGCFFLTGPAPKISKCQPVSKFRKFDEKVLSIRIYLPADTSRF